MQVQHHQLGSGTLKGETSKKTRSLFTVIAKEYLLRTEIQDSRLKETVTASSLEWLRSHEELKDACLVTGVLRRRLRVVDKNQQANCHSGLSPILQLVGSVQQCNSACH